MILTRRVKLILVAVVAVIILAALIAVLVVFLGGEDNPASKVTFKTAAVTANGQECAAIGKNILEKRGSAADAAIAMLFCDGIACGQCMGLGGGFLLTMYTRATGVVRVLNAREKAPAGATEGMFDGGNISTTVGGMAVAIPGELRGYKALYDEYGKLPWAELIKPSIELCRTGYIVTKYFANVLKERAEKIKIEPSLREVFINPATNEVWIEGDRVKRPKLANTLEIIAKEGADALHNGSLTKSFVADIKAMNGIITETDMNNYRPTWQDPLKIDLGGNLTLNTVPLPGAGHILAFMINVLKGWAFPESENAPPPSIPSDGVQYWQRIIETFKYAYAKRTGLGDLNFMPKDKIQPLLDNLTSIEYAHHIRSLIRDNSTHQDWQHYGALFDILEDHGTAHISVVAPNGDAIAVTSTINFILGAFFLSPSTGIILNNEMDDFSNPNVTSIYGLPPSPSNYPRAGKNPLSSMCPSIVIDKDIGARLVVGAAGGTKITTQVALVIMKHILRKIPLYEAINTPRLHHQLFPMQIDHEYDFDANVLKQLKQIGHNISEVKPNSGFAALNAVSFNREIGMYQPRTDKRRPGSVDGI